MFDKDITDNDLLDEIEEAEIEEEKSSSIITNPFGIINLPNDVSIDLNSFERMLEENLSSSYKIFWFFGIYKEIIIGNKYMGFKRLVCRMIASAWYPVTQYKLNLGIQDRIYDLVILIHEKYNIPCDEREDKFLDFLENLRDMEVEKRIKNLYGYVPYRLLTPFYSKELSEVRKNFGKNASQTHKFIAKLSKEDSRGIYKIDMENKLIEVNDSWYKYIRDNQIIIAGWMNFKLISYLQKKNPNVPAIPFKISAPGKRDLREATKLWKEINKDGNINDIYTGEKLRAENFALYGELSIDHFIPWSFVLHDELWNLIPTFKNVNSQKNNKLPDLKVYMDKFCEIQYESFDTMQRNHKKYKKNLEGYLAINIAADGRRKIEKDEFERRLRETIEPLYQIAYNQGYGVWGEAKGLNSKVR